MSARKLRFFSALILVAVIGLLLTPSLYAQIESGRHGRARIVQPINEADRIALTGNTHPEARSANDRGPVANDFAMEHMLLQLKRSPEQELAVEQFLEGLQSAGSANFHHWLTAQEFGERFGLAKSDLDAVTAWLESRGFRLNIVYPSGMLIDFSGTAAQVRKAFQTEIHYLAVKGERHIGNMSDPRIPAALAPVIAGVVSLHDFRPHTMHHLRKANKEFTSVDILGDVTYAVVPADLAKIYNLNPLFSAGISGQGQTIVLIEDTDVFSASDWTTFRQTFGLSSYSSASFTQVHPPAPLPLPGNNCAAPGVVAGNDAEAILDAEWASASAPSAAIEMAACKDTSTTFGGLIAIQNLINATTPPPSIMSISYGQCETVNGAAANAAYNSAYQQAVAEGVSVFVAAGDSGAAGCDNSAAEATHGIAVSAFASTPNNVAVGGTDFSDTFSGTNTTYWNSTNTPTFGSVLSYLPEIPWNDSCASALVSAYEGFSQTYGSSSLCNAPLIGSLLMSTVAGGGGPSQCASGTPSTAGVVSGSCAGWPKPSWQTLLGNPSDGVRDTPDVSLFASDGVWSHFYVFCWSDTANGGAACGSDPSTWAGAGGTSFASPIMAGIQALINQKAGGPQGNPAPVYYQLAAAEYGASGNSSCNSDHGNTVGGNCIFYDVTSGDMDVDCVGPNCYLADGAVGVLSTSTTSFAPAYGTNVGWDFATGIGSVNAANLVNNWPSSSNPAVLTITKTHTGNFTQGQQHAIYTVTVSNQANAGSTNGTVTVTETQPSGLTLVSMAGTGWTCATNSCTRSDVLNGGGSYPSITVTVNVASNASSPQVNQVSVSGGGTASASATDSTTIVVTPAAPTGLSATAGNAQVSLSWNSSTGATSYNVLRSTTNGGPYASIVTGLTATSYSDTGLTNGTTYYYVTQAVNSAGTSANSNQASATPSASSSWSNGYTYRRAVTIDHTKVPNTDQANFPMLFSGTYSYLATTSNGGNASSVNGYDIIFTSDASGTSTLPFERETYNASTGAVNFWVKVPTVSHSSDTVFYMFYGNSSVTTDQSNKTGVWDSSFKSVWHLPNGSTLSASDSTSNGNNGTNNGASAATGKIDGGASFNGTSNYIDVPSSSTFGGYGTVSFSAWIKPSQVNVDQVILIRPVSTTAANPWEYWGFGVASSGSVFAAVSSGIAGSRILTTSSGTISTNVWTHVYVTYDGSTLRTYINGAVDPTTGSGNITIGSGSKDIGIGQSFISGFEEYFDGLIDEARFSSTARSADWIATEYNNQNGPTFYTVGAAVTSGP